MLVPVRLPLLVPLPPRPEPTPTLLPVMLDLPLLRAADDDEGKVDDDTAVVMEAFLALIRCIANADASRACFSSLPLFPFPFPPFTPRPRLLLPLKVALLYLFTFIRSLPLTLLLLQPPLVLLRRLT